MFDLRGGLKGGAFSSQPLTFISGPASDDLSTCLQIHLLENGTRSIREDWQLKQLINLLQHAYANSGFWKSRLPSQLSGNNILGSIPVLTRDDVNCQVADEGALVVANDLGHGMASYPSSGSTGVPVKVFSMPQNARYNEIRSIAQYFIEGRNLNFNRTFIKPADGNRASNGKSVLDVEINDGWAGNIGDIFQHGKYKAINFSGNINPLIDELLKSPVGYLACLSSHMELLFNAGGEKLLQDLNIEMWLHHSDNLDPSLRSALNRINIPIRSSYSCSEVGPLAIECASNPGVYHVAHSNVIIEESNHDTVVIDGVNISKLLVTHLHSYATPLIRYDLGDFGKIHSKCVCGHDGPTLSNIFGRKKFFLKRQDDTLIPFLVFSKPLLDILKFKEFFIYQLDHQNLIVELGGVEANSEIHIERLKKYISDLSGGFFTITINIFEKIDWAKNPKRIPFICYI